MLSLNREELKGLLSKAFEEGFCGYRDLKEDFIESVLREIEKRDSNHQIPSFIGGSVQIPSAIEFPPIPSPLSFIDNGNLTITVQQPISDIQVNFEISDEMIYNHLQNYTSNVA